VYKKLQADASIFYNSSHIEPIKGLYETEYVMYRQGTQTEAMDGAESLSVLKYVFEFR
jgi:hypothetical protein